MLHSHPQTGQIQWDRIAVRTVLAMLVSFAAACATQAGATPFAPYGQPLAHSKDVTVEVRNTSYYDVVVRVDRSGVGHRLGTVRSGEFREMKVPRAIARSSNFVLVAEQVHGPAVLTTVPLTPLMGQKITWEVGDTRFAHRLSIR